MKRLLVLAGCAVLLFSGCQELGGDRRAGEVIIEGDGEFPQFLVGTWRADDVRWELTFDCNGSITSMWHHFVSVAIDVAEGGAFEQGREGAHSIYVLGLCSARYDRSKGELSVEITIDYFEVVLPVGTVEGKMTDYFTGPISEDGTRWTAEWRSYGELVGADKPDPNSIRPKRVVFSKVQTK